MTNITNIPRLEKEIYETQVEQWIDFLKIINKRYEWWCSTYKHLKWKAISRFVKYQTIKKYPNVPWCPYEVSRNPNITWNDIQGKYRNIAGLSENPNITMDIIQKYPELNWNWSMIIKTKDITHDILVKHYEYADYYCRNPAITCNDIDSSLYSRLWNWYEFSYNPNLTWKCVRENMDKNWNWKVIICREFVTMETLDELYEFYIQHKNSKQIIGHNYKALRKCFSANPNITWDDIKDHTSQKSKKWDWEKLSCNPSMTYKIIQDNIDMRKWNWKTMASNPSLTWKFILDNEDKEWNWVLFYDNPFTLQLDLVRQECIRKWTNAANKIRNWWLFKVYFNPFHTIGERRLIKSYQEMMVNDTG